MSRIIVFTFIILFISSCDEINKLINPPSEDYLVVKTIYTSVDEQIIEYNNEIKMIFPGESVSGNLEIKVKKETSVPKLNINNTQLGNNTFRIKYKGESSFLKPIQLILNYDQSKISNGKSALTSVVGYVYVNGMWKMGDYKLDEANKKIIFSISNLANPIVNKDNLVLLKNEGEIIIGDGYTTTDTGNEDNLLLNMKKYQVSFISKSNPGGRVVLSNIHEIASNTIDTIPLSFQGNFFSADYVSHPELNPEDINPETSFYFNYAKFSFNGEIDNNNYKLIKKFFISESRHYFSSQFGWDDELTKLSINNMKLIYESKTRDTIIYQVSGNELSLNVLNFEWSFKDFWENKNYNESIGSINSITFKLTK